MQKIKDLKLELLDRDFKGKECRIFGKGLTGTFKVKDVSFEVLEGDISNNYYYVGENLIIDLGVGKFHVCYESSIEKINEPLYKWGYKIKSIDIDNNVTNEYTIEIGETFSDEELINIVMND